MIVDCVSSVMAIALVWMLQWAQSETERSVGKIVELGQIEKNLNSMGFRTPSIMTRALCYDSTGMWGVHLNHTRTVPNKHCTDAIHSTEKKLYFI